MIWFQEEVVLQPRPRGIHLITDEIIRGVADLDRVATGIAHIFIQHTSASISINENADPDVRTDVENFINRLVPEDEPYFRHTMEGSDDMPAHIKAMMFGANLTLPVRDGRFRLGTWQGIYLCEHRNRASSRRVIVTVAGSGG